MPLKAVPRGGRLALGLLAGVCSGCGPWEPPVVAIPVPAARTEPEPERGELLLPPLELTKMEDAVVRVVGEVTCTGTLVADDLVLTAHHCVSARDEQGRVLPRDQAPESIEIELGGDYLPWGDVGVRAVVAPSCGWASGHGDIAILVLSRKLIGFETMTPRITKPPAMREEVHPWGFGRCAASADGIRREARLGGAVDALAPGQFRAVASICPGDSGGPAYSAGTAEVVGVISAAVMDGDENTAANAYFTRLDAWSHLFSAAREIADGASPAELPPFRACP